MGFGGVYTREVKWKYPDLGNVSYYIGGKDINRLEKNIKYKARLLLVDYEGWVSHIALKQFMIDK